MATRAKNRKKKKKKKKKKTTFKHLLLGQFQNDWFQNDFTEMFLLCPFIKIAKIVLLCWTKWSSELKIEKPLNDISVASGNISK